ncbi:thermonuclease family protein [Parerythrobacter jejuensis]|uniref:TNase-like domain-containing protein n=1 Tax=Parerythrobacter jejuensis TaxID=795812 RepID=A0A845AKF4_9SPHN|nr:hypothetical protein [Parerythrobacter jejuensis]MXP31232.1 hypothetical protein [Parerythrobacter jejuensis]MXP33992.1 hypothetical protein [Parerythrobacter jejuensis]
MSRPLRFDARWTRKRRWRARLRKAGWWLVIALIAAGIWFARDRLMPVQEWQEVRLDLPICGTRGAAGCVVDGDTIAIGKRRVRLTGFDAPELDGACDAEREAARIARSALHDWLAQGPFEWSGGDAPPYDQYGRELRSIRRGDEELGETLIARGLARESGWGFPRSDWCE